MSKTSVERDVSMIMNYSVDSEDDFLVDRRKPEEGKLFGALLEEDLSVELDEVDERNEAKH